MIKKNKTLGFYQPGFLHLRINTNADLVDLLTCKIPANNEIMSTFLHEYIHFLQDISTTSGMINACRYMDFIKENNQNIIGSKSDTFEVPVEVTNNYNVKINTDLKKLSSGKFKDVKSILYNDYIEETVVLEDKKGKRSTHFKYTVYYTNLENRIEENLLFGYLFLKEYVAHKIQEKYFPGTFHIDIPYLLPELIVAKEYKKLSKDKMHIVALCDACLMHSNPAEMFFKVLEKMISSNFIPNKVNDVYEFAYKEFSLKEENDQSLIEYYKYMVNITKDHFDDALKAPYFEFNKSWINHILTEGQYIREKSPSFIIDLIQNEGEFSDYFYKIVGVLGTPYITNSDGVGCFQPPLNMIHLDIQPYQLLIFQQIFLLYAEGTTQCNLYESCKNVIGNDFTNHHCLEAPWKRIQDEEVCSFVQIWSTWGLTNKIPVKIKKKLKGSVPFN